MKISLSSIRKISADGPVRLMLYGPPGIGKTTLASEFPAPIFIQTEDSAPVGVTADTFGIVKSFDEILEIMRLLFAAKHDYQTLVVDSVSILQDLIHRKTCNEYNSKQKRPSDKIRMLDELKFGRGFPMAKPHWISFLEGLNHLRRRGMSTILIAHARVEKFENPAGDDYDHYCIDLHRTISNRVALEMDAIIFMHPETTAKKNGSRMVYMNTRETEAYMAKNRYNMPDKLSYTHHKGYAVLSKYLPPTYPTEPLGKYPGFEEHETEEHETEEHESEINSTSNESSVNGNDRRVGADSRQRGSHPVVKPALKSTESIMRKTQDVESSPVEIQTLSPSPVNEPVEGNGLSSQEITNNIVAKQAKQEDDSEGQIGWIPREE